MKFLLKIKMIDSSVDEWIYDTFDNHIISERFGDLNPNKSVEFPTLPSFNFGDKVEKKISDIRYMEINLGFKCNLKCDYCPQSKLKNAFKNASPKDIDNFIKRLKVSKENGLNPRFIRFWGGEPLVYWKVLQKLVPKVREIYPNAKFSLCTNGYLLTKEKVDWLCSYDFMMSVSHDGCNYQEEEYRKSLLAVDCMEDLINYAIEKMGHNFHFSATINPETPNTEEKIIFFNKKFNKNYSLISLPFKYNESNMELNKFHFNDDQRKEMTNGLRDALVNNYENIHGMPYQHQSFERRIVTRSNIDTVQYFCNMPFWGIVVDMNGDVFNCHFRYQKTGTLEDFNKTPATNSCSWHYREKCKECPFIQLCGGGCTNQSHLEHRMSCDDVLYWCNFGVFKGTFKRLFNVDVEEIIKL